MDWFKFRMCWCLPLQFLTDEEAGKVIKAVAAYMDSGEELEFSGKEGIMLRRIITQLRDDLARLGDANAQKEDARARRKEAARKAADARWHRDACDKHDGGIVPALPNIEKEKERDTDTETEGEKDIYCSELPSAASELPVAEIPLVDGSVYPVSREEAETYAELYPAVDIPQALRNIRGWCMSNPGRRKTKKGVKRFINNWLCREQDKGGVCAAGVPRGAPVNPYLEMLRELEARKGNDTAAGRSCGPDQDDKVYGGGEAS